MMKNLLVIFLYFIGSIVPIQGKIINDENSYYSLKSQYLYNSFVDGKIHFKNGTKTEGELNYNVLAGEFHYIENGLLKTFSDFDLGRISKIVLKNKNFLIKSNTIYEIIYPDKMVLLNKRSPIIKNENQNTGAYGTNSNTSSNTKILNISHAIGHEMEKGVLVNIKDELNEIEIKIQESFSILFNNQIYNANKKSFFILYPEHKDTIKNFIKTEKIKFKTPEEIIKLITFCKNL